MALKILFRVWGFSALLTLCTAVTLVISYSSCQSTNQPTNKSGLIGLGGHHVGWVFPNWNDLPQAVLHCMTHPQIQVTGSGLGIWNRQPVGTSIPNYYQVRFSYLHAAGSVPWFAVITQSIPENWERDRKMQKPGRWQWQCCAPQSHWHSIRTLSSQEKKIIKRKKPNLLFLGLNQLQWFGLPCNEKSPSKALPRMGAGVPSVPENCLLTVV